MERKKLSDMKVERDWLSFYPRFSKQGFTFEISPWRVFNSKTRIHTNVTSLLYLITPLLFGWEWFLVLSPMLLFSWGELLLKFGIFRDKNNEYDYPCYGIIFYSVNGETPNYVCIRHGKKTRIIYLPWHKKLYKREFHAQNGGTTDKEHEAIKERHLYKYTLESGFVQDRMASVVEKKITWTSWWGLKKEVERRIEVKFNLEVGEDTGSWKGGVLGTSFQMKEDETALQALRRMEKTLKF